KCYHYIIQGTPARLMMTGQTLLASPPIIVDVYARNICHIDACLWLPWLCRDILGLFHYERFAQTFAFLALPELFSGLLRCRHPAIEDHASCKPNSGLNVSILSDDGFNMG